MKKLISGSLLAAMLVLQLGGCGSREDTTGTQNPEAAGASETGDEQNVSHPADSELSVSSGGILDPSAVLAFAGKDNSLDVYSAVLRAPLRAEESENAVGGVTETFLGASRAYLFKKHVLSSFKESWDEICFVDTEGETGSEHIDIYHQLWGIGPAAGTDHYVAFMLEEQEGTEDLRYFFEEMDANHEKVREFPLDFLSGDETEVLDSILDFAEDQSGTMHMMWRTEGRQKYLLVSPEGEILAECFPEGTYNRKFIPLYDGRVALLSITNNGSGSMVLQYMDAETRELVTLASWEKVEKNILYITLLDEKTLLYADAEGVYRSGLSGGNPELLYRWANHGIIAHGVSGMGMDEEGRIRILYEDSEDYHYLCLNPTTEDVPICEITMAVRDTDIERYQWAVVEFNKRYPVCHIELAGYENPNDTALLTQLTAGNGPVLLDSYFLVNFEDLEALWEPLDTVMEQLGISQELNPNVLEMGKINGTLYGMISDFSLQTVVAGDPDLKDWDYDAFFRCVQDRPELEALFNYYNGESGLYQLIFGFLSHGLEDSYFFAPDAETGAMHFDSDRFREALELAKKYCSREEGVLPGSSLLDGKVLYNIVSISRPEYLAAYRTVYGEDIDYIGYPTKDGAAHFMSSYNMLSIRRSAAKEEKETAAAFLALYFSYEGQSHAAKDINYGLSARRDVLEDQIAGMGTTAGYFNSVNIYGFGDINLKGKLNIELDGKTLLDMVDAARVLKVLPRELRNIISEELELYYRGDITEDMLIDHLESRVGLYLAL